MQSPPGMLPKGRVNLPQSEGWEYKHHPDYGCLAPRCTDLVRDLIKTPADYVARISDSRSSHERLFVGLTPANMPLFAGHYRGKNIPYLMEYEVRVDGDPKVGIPAAFVGTYMHEFASVVSDWLLRFDQFDSTARGTPAEATILDALVRLVANIISRFVLIHPYGNGNGHIGRFLVWVTLVNRQLIPRSWPLDDHPDCDELIRDHHNGKTAGLENFILDAISQPTSGNIAKAFI